MKRRRLAEETAADVAWTVPDDVLGDRTAVHVEYGREFRLPDGTATAFHLTVSLEVRVEDPTGPLRSRACSCESFPSPRFCAILGDGDP